MWGKMLREAKPNREKLASREPCYGGAIAAIFSAAQNLHYYPHLPRSRPGQRLWVAGIQPRLCVYLGGFAGWEPGGF